MLELNALTPAQFESLTFDLMQALGLKNCVWRTPGRDAGRDIQGEFYDDDFSGYVRKENWYVECKRYAESVSWPTVWEKIAYAESNSADVLLFITSSTLSPQAVDEVARWNASRRGTNIRFWNGSELRARLNLFPQLLIKYGLSTDPIRDGAVSVLPLTKILLKYANTGSAYSEFEMDRIRIDAAIHALSELITARIEEIERAGVTSTEIFKADKDALFWLTDNLPMQELRFDRYAIRAILNVIWCHSKSAAPTTAKEGDSLVVSWAYLPAASLQNDLETLAFWGRLNCSFRPDTLQVELKNDIT